MDPLRNHFLLCCLLTFALCSCAASPANTPASTGLTVSQPATTVSSSAKPSVLPFKTITPTASRSAPLQPFFTPTDIPNFYLTLLVPNPTATGLPLASPLPASTFDPSNIPTWTPQAAAQCPAEKPGLVADFKNLENHLIDNQILDFLDAGGTRSAAIAGIRKLQKTADATVIQENDVTGDGVPDLLFTEMPLILNVFICKDGQYQRQLPIAEAGHAYQPFIVDIDDLNLDGMNEIVTKAGDDRSTGIWVLEWDGSEFQNLKLTGDYYENNSCGLLVGPSALEIRDTDGNGTKELILEQGIPIWIEYYYGLPWRKQTRTCSWNGFEFVMTHSEYSPPEYRFQAVQDGDVAALAGEYDRAIAFYQEAIFSDKLEWWSPERRAYERLVAQMQAVHTPVPLPTLTPDPSEYGYLASYARYRILLIHVVRGYLPEAKIVFDTLQANFPKGQPGHEFAAMAKVFWDEYQVSADIGLACQAAIAFPDKDIALTFLGSDYHGEQSHTYVPEDVCPFTSAP